MRASGLGRAPADEGEAQMEDEEQAQREARSANWVKLYGLVAARTVSFMYPNASVP